MDGIQRRPYMLAVLGKLRGLAEVHGPELRVIEIGVFRADLTSLILMWFPKCRVWGIDPWEPYGTEGEYRSPCAGGGGGAWRKRKRVANRRVTEYGAGRCALLEMTSDRAAVILSNTAKQRHLRLVARDFHLIFIDGLHTRRQVFRDISNYYPLLCPGGIMGGHDLCDRSLGVGAALRDVGRPYTVGFDDTWWYDPVSTHASKHSSYCGS